MVKATPANIVPIRLAMAEESPRKAAKVDHERRAGTEEGPKHHAKEDATKKVLQGETVKSASQQEGVKRISQQSIQNIRAGGAVVEVSVEEGAGGRSHLPGPHARQPPKQVTRVPSMFNSNSLSWLTKQQALQTCKKQTLLHYKIFLKMGPKV